MAKKNLSKVIFKFTSAKGNVCHKLVTKTFNSNSGEITTGESLITEAQAVEFSKDFDIEIKDLDAETEE